MYEVWMVGIMKCYQVVKVIEVAENAEFPGVFTEAPEEHNMVYSKKVDAQRRCDELIKRSGKNNYAVYEFNED
jgi:hypothetical protein